MNLLTDVAPALAIALRPPRSATPEGLLAEGPEASLGRSLDRAILARSATTAAGAEGAWVLTRFTGGQRRASTVALVGLIGTQLGQTLVSGGRDPAVLAASLGSAAVLAGIVQTPGVSHFFGCTPLGPLGWAVGGGASLAATSVSALAPEVIDAAARAGAGPVGGPVDEPAATSTKQ